MYVWFEIFKNEIKFCSLAFYCVGYYFCLFDGASDVSTLSHLISFFAIYPLEPECVDKRAIAIFLNFVCTKMQNVRLEKCLASSIKQNILIHVAKKKETNFSKLEGYRF